MINTILFLTAAAASYLVVTKAWQQHSQSWHHGAKKQADANNDSDNKNVKHVVSVAFLGNSMLYFNDCPRLVERLLLECGCYDDANANSRSRSRVRVHQESCLRGGATLSSLWEKGNGMQEKFRTLPAKRRKNNGDDDEDDDDCEYDIGAPTVSQLIQNQQAWLQQQQQEQQESNTTTSRHSTTTTLFESFIVLNDHTQGPTREKTRQQTIEILQSAYAPLIYYNDDSAAAESSSSTVVPPPPPVVIFIQTPAYKVEGMRGSEDLGSFDEFTNRVAHGVAQYAQVMQQERNNQRLQIIPQQQDAAACRVAPVGEAFRYLRHHNPELWSKLYSWDNFHPSPHGTWLQACVLFGVMTKRPVPVETCGPLLRDMSSTSWWHSWSRRMQPPEEGALPLPTFEEALELVRVASLVCGFSSSSDDATADDDTILSKI